MMPTWAKVVLAFVGIILAIKAVILTAWVILALIPSTRKRPA
jgi:hypothetical protein